MRVRNRHEQSALFFGSLLGSTLIFVADEIGSGHQRWVLPAFTTVLVVTVVVALVLRFTMH